MRPRHLVASLFLAAALACGAQAAVPRLQTQLLGQSSWLSGSRATLRLRVLDHQTGQGVADASVKITLRGPQGPIVLFDGKPDALGEVAAQFEVPDLPKGAYPLEVRVSALGETDVISQSVALRSQARLLLTTDKPLYQPGQVMHLRALALDEFTLKPLALSPVTIEVEDSKGNKVFKRSGLTSEYGVAFADFQLANEINMGSYRVRAVTDKGQVEQVVTVEKYALPKFRLTLTPDRAFYRPGDTLRGDIQADYFFGKPVQGSVLVELSQFDAGFTKFAEITGTLDASGHLHFEQQLPTFFAGVPLEQGNAFVKIDTTVKDTAEQTVTITSTVPVAKDALRITLIPESGQIAKGVENLIYAVVSTPSGQPAPATVTLTTSTGQKVTDETDGSGLAVFPITPADNVLTITAEARDGAGNTGSTKQDLYGTYYVETLLLRPDRAIYRVGDVMDLTFLGTAKSGRVYVDVIRNRQTVLTAAGNLESGRGSLSVPLGPDLAGTLELHAYRITPEGEIVRDTRTVFVNPTNDLRISVRADQESYLPGGTARLNLHVAGADNAGVSAALGVNVVDEAVFALQDMQPGMEKVYYLLEQQILQPKYEIHAIDPGDIVETYPPGPAPDPKAEEVRQRAAQALFAQAEPKSDLTLKVDTFDQKLIEINERYRFMALHEALKVARAVTNFKRKFKRELTASQGMTMLVRTRLLPWYPVDPFGNRWTVTANNGRNYANGFQMRSRGEDGKIDTSDDFWAGWSPGSDPYAWGGVTQSRGPFGRDKNTGDGGWGPWPGGEDGGPLGPPPPGGPPPPPPPPAAGGEDPPTGGEQPAAPDVRIRQYFPETLYSNPAVITDASGNATLDIPLADSITTWRLTALASSLGGSLGSTTAPLRVFQDFFVDIDFPRTLTQGDEVSVPIAIYNYLAVPQTIRLQVEPEDWYELVTLPTFDVSVGPNEVKAVPLTLIAKGLGYQRLTVKAFGSSLSDAVRREVEILPSGERMEVTENGRLKESLVKTIHLPEEGVEGAYNLLVKVYPGIFSQVVEGMDSILQMPYGCFEQTSSATYPNVLALGYMEATSKASPEVAMKAEGYINLGYQKLLAFEVPGGGFSWFGDAPANKVLTAYGLLEFNDMSRVYSIDPALVPRVQAWLLGQQESNGTWLPDAAYLHEESWGRIQHSEILPTAYVTWALAESGEKGEKVMKAAQALQQLVTEVGDPYSLGLVANAFLSIDRDSPAGAAVLDRLVEMRKIDDEGRVYWGTTVSTITHASREVADLETTALITYAFVRSGRYADVTNRALNYLIANKDPRGIWPSTQATVFALKALLLSVTGQTDSVDATVTVKVNGQPAAEWRLTPADADVMRQVECKDLVRPGDNEVSLEWAGQGESLFQITGIAYTPWPAEPPSGGSEPLSIDVQYDRNELATNDILTAKAHVAWNGPGDAKMVMLDLGIPPGFEVVTDDLAAMVEREQIQKYNLTGRQIVIYLEELKNGSPLDLVYRLRAKYPIKAQTPPSSAYLYYNPEVKDEAQPVKLVVQ